MRLSMGTDRDPAQAVFQRGATAAKARMCAAGVAVFLGAFDGPDLVADLGIVDCGEGIARYQSVVTAEPHRRRGLASHLLGVAADWAHARACDRLVILADADGAPSHLYRSLGFSPVLRSAQAYCRRDAIRGCRRRARGRLWLLDERREASHGLLRQAVRRAFQTARTRRASSKRCVSRAGAAAVGP